MEGEDGQKSSVPFCHGRRNTTVLLARPSQQTLVKTTETDSYRVITKNSLYY